MANPFASFTDRYLLFLVAAFIAAVTMYPSVVTLTLDFSRVPITSKAEAGMLAKSGPAIALHYALYAVTLFAIAASIVKAFIGPRALPLTLVIASIVAWIILTAVFYKKNFHVFWPHGLSVVPHVIFFFWLAVFGAIDSNRQDILRGIIAGRLNALLAFFAVFIFASGASVIILTNTLLTPAFGDEVNTNIIKEINFKTVTAIIISHAVITLAAFVAYGKMFLRRPRG